MSTRDRPGAAQAELLKRLPAVEEALLDAGVASAASGLPRALAVEFVRRAIAGWRGEIQRGALERAALEARLAEGALARAVAELAAAERRRGIRRCLNATGVVLNTGLGRAPLHPQAARRMAEVASGYSILEVDRASGERSQRDERAGELVGRLVGSQAAIAVNNNAGACLLALSALASGREVVVSRGELVEIGGAFRMPAVMEKAGCKLREVGTTNRTRLADYRAAMGEGTGLLLKVHRSNFKLVGFGEEASIEELAALGRERGVPVFYDLGSGLYDGEGGEGGEGGDGGAGGAALQPLAPALDGEPSIEAAVASGADLVSFSGDKLLGGPQAGIVCGSLAAVQTARRDPLYRALRLDKSQLAALEATLELYLSGRGNEIPARALLAAGPEELKRRAEAIAAALARGGCRAEVVAASSQPGSGSAPGVELPTSAVRVEHPRLSAGALARALRQGEPAVFARIHADALLVDPRTLLAGEDDELVRAFRALD
jgi:L-seryl-tRNA(Ser) seleniumtransferase